MPNELTTDQVISSIAFSLQGADGEFIELIANLCRPKDKQLTYHFDSDTFTQDTEEAVEVTKNEEDYIRYYDEEDDPNKGKKSENTP